MKFNFDNKFFRALDKVVDAFFLSILWTLFSLPIVTMGAASTALYYTVHKSLRRSRGYVARTFVGAFKDNFKQATPMWLIGLVMYAILIFDCMVINNSIMFYLFLLMILFVLAWRIYVIGYTARFENKVGAIMKNSLVMMIANFPWTILLVVMAIVSGIILYVVPFMILLLPATLLLLYDVILEKIFRKYMSEEDLANEKESDMIDRD